VQIATPQPERRWAIQGFGRASFFVFMDDERGSERLAREFPADSRGDLEFGRSLARGFTGVDRPDELHDYIAADGELRVHRLLGVTWALTARRMNDPAYFDECLARAGSVARRTLAALPAICEAAQSAAPDYATWQARTGSGLHCIQ